MRQEAGRTVLSCCAAASGSSERGQIIRDSAHNSDLYHGFEQQTRPLTSVLTSRTDLKSLDIEANLDWVKYKKKNKNYKSCC